jgi:hypothetical protein
VPACMSRRAVRMPRWLRTVMSGCICHRRGMVMHLGLSDAWPKQDSQACGGEHAPQAPIHGGAPPLASRPRASLRIAAR